MPQTQQNGNQQSNTATTEDGSSSSLQNANSKLSEYFASIEGKKISMSTMRNEIFNALFDGATDNPSVGKYYIFEYDPKFKDQLKVWDQFPLIQVMEFKKGNVLGANLHHVNAKSRLSAINNNRFPESILRYYIPKNADSIFFEVDDLDVPKLSQFPLEKFHRNR